VKAKICQKRSKTWYGPYFNTENCKRQLTMYQCGAYYFRCLSSSRLWFCLFQLKKMCSKEYIL